VARIEVPSHNSARRILVDDRYIHLAMAADRTSLDTWIVRLPRCGGEAVVVAKTSAYGPFFLEDGAVIWGDALRQGWRLGP
jgi:hypothetical protein